MPGRLAEDSSAGATPGRRSVDRSVSNAIGPAVDTRLRFRSATASPSARATRRPRAAGDAAVGRDARSRQHRLGPLPASRRDRPWRHGGDPQGSRRRSGTRAGDQGACSSRTGAILMPCAGSSRRRRSAASCSIRGSCRSTSWGVSRPAPLFRDEAGQGTDPGRSWPSATTAPKAGSTIPPARAGAGLTQRRRGSPDPALLDRGAGLPTPPSLRPKVSPGPRTTSTASSAIFEQICQTMAYAHARE